MNKLRKYLRINIIFIFWRFEIIKYGLRVEEILLEDIRNSLGYYKCWDVICGFVFKIKVIFKRYIYNLKVLVNVLKMY